MSDIESALELGRHMGFCHDIASFQEFGSMGFSNDHFFHDTIESGISEFHFSGIDRRYFAEGRDFSVVVLEARWFERLSDLRNVED